MQAVPNINISITERKFSKIIMTSIFQQFKIISSCYFTDNFTGKVTAVYEGYLLTLPTGCLRQLCMGRCMTTAVHINF